MPLKWRIPLLLSIALLLAASGIFPPTVEAQTNGLVPKGDAGLDSSSQAPPDTHRSISLISWHVINGINRRLGDQVDLEGSLNLDVPRLDRNNGGGFENSFYRLVNLDERVNQRDDSSAQVLAPLPIASTTLQVPSELLTDSDSAGAPDVAPPLPNPPRPSHGWHVGISPYLWFAGVHGTVGALGHEASVDASFRDIFFNFNIGLMFALEPRYNRIVMPFDFMWMKLSDDKALPFEVGPTSVKAKINQVMFAQKIGYRVIDSEKLKLDGLIGFRYWHMGTTLTLQPQIANGFYESANWADVVAGARFQAMLSKKAVFTVLGDAGGGGANSDYQVVGLLGWKCKKATLQGGWRYLSVNYRPGGSASFIYDMATSGLIFGATIPLK
jgi:hypothetical protein